MMVERHSPLEGFLSFEPTREAGLARWARFLDRAGTAYARERNFDLASDQTPGVSGLSPYFRHRLISEEEVLAQAIDRHGLKVAEQFVQEVVWRTYWKGWLEMRPNVWADYGHQHEADQADWLDGGDRQGRYERAIAGETGIAGFDDWVTQLIETGYLHNHARMWFASIWVFTLRLPWTLGAAFFLNHLLDGDPASNTLSWRWVAGLQTRGKAYRATAENIHRFTRGRFAPKGLIEALPTIEAPEHPKPIALPKQPTAGQALHRPVVWLAHSEDLSWIEGHRDHPNIKAVVWLETPEVEPQARRSQFAQQAIDAMARPGERRITLDQWTQLDDICLAVGAEGIVSPTIPIGPLADAVRAHEQKPLKHPVVWMRRAYDTQLWPLATKGFFPFKAQVLGSSPLIETIV